MPHVGGSAPSLYTNCSATHYAPSFPRHDFFCRTSCTLAKLHACTVRHVLWCASGAHPILACQAVRVVASLACAVAASDTM